MLFACLFKCSLFNIFVYGSWICIYLMNILVNWLIKLYVLNVLNVFDFWSVNILLWLTAWTFHCYYLLFGNISCSEIVNVYSYIKCRFKLSVKSFLKNNKIIFFRSFTFDMSAVSQFFLNLWYCFLHSCFGDLQLSVQLVWKTCQWTLLCRCDLLQAMLDVTADAGLLATSLQVISIMQMVMQARWSYENSILMLPHLKSYHLAQLRRPWVFFKYRYSFAFIANVLWWHSRF